MEPPVVIVIVVLPTITIALILLMDGADLLPHAIAPPSQEEGLRSWGAGRASLIHKINPADQNAGEMAGMADVAVATCSNKRSAHLLGPINSVHIPPPTP